MAITRRQRRPIIIAASAAGAWLLVVVLRVIFSGIDYARIDGGRFPVFYVSRVAFSDGGTVRYQGLGYEITRLCRFHVEDGQPTGYDYGPILKYQLNWLLLPLADRKHVRYVVKPSDARTESTASLPGEAEPDDAE